MIFFSKGNHSHLSVHFTKGKKEVGGGIFERLVSQQKGNEDGKDLPIFKRKNEFQRLP